MSWLSTDALVQNDESSSLSAQGHGMYAAGGTVMALLGCLSCHTMLTIRVQANK